MKELRDIVKAIDALGPDERAVLATVVDLQGSGYRLPGARMLISSDGSAIGTVSGGCLEADVLERASRVLATGRPEIFTYDTTADEDSVFSLNMGCRGVIRILLESVHKESELIRSLSRARNDRETQFIATVLTGEGVGTRGYLNESWGYRAIPAGTLTGGIETALRAFSTADKDWSVERIESAEGSIELALEKISPPVHVLLFGAGADAVPFADLAADLGWQVTVYDHRPGYLSSARFPDAKELVLLGRDGPPDISAGNSRTAVVIMTHNYARDLAILPAVLETDAFYIGLLGPRSRTTQLLDDLSISQGLDRLYAPIGLDIGGSTPEGIALAIAAEIQSVLSSREGGHLREREGSIYDRR